MAAIVTIAEVLAEYPQLEDLEQAAYKAEIIEDIDLNDNIQRAQDWIAREVKKNTDMEWDDITNQDDYKLAIIYRTLADLMAMVPHNQTWIDMWKVQVARYNDELSRVRPTTDTAIGKRSVGPIIIGGLQGS